MAGKTITLDVRDSDTIDELKARVEEKEGIPASEQVFTYRGNTLDNLSTLSDYNIQDGSTLDLIMLLQGGGLDIHQDGWVLRDGRKDFQVESYHVSCQSKRPDATGNYFGIVMYKNGRSTSWTCNGSRVRSGYIYITDESCMTEITTREPGTGHGKAYRRLFGETKRKGVIVGGFAIMGGAWKYNSNSCNTGHPFSDGNKEMNEHEQRFVKNAVLQWMHTGEQNYKVGDGGS